MKVTKTDDILLRLAIEDKLHENGGYCPCRIEQTIDTKCMCKEFRDQLSRKENGVCHCGLYIKVKDE